MNRTAKQTKASLTDLTDLTALTDAGQFSVANKASVPEATVALELSRWVGKAVDDGLTSHQALAELRGRAVPWRAP